MGNSTKGLVLITGTTSGVGLNTLKPLLRFGWEVIAVNRSNKRAIEIAHQSLTDSEMKNMHFIEIDLSDLDDVRNGCDEILKKFKKPINSMICNAAVYKPRLRKPERSAQGFENSMAVNHFGHFLMINLLIDKILSSENEIYLNGKVTKFKPRITVLGTVTANYSELGGRIPIPAPANLGNLSGFKNGFLAPISMANGKKFKPGKAYKDSKLCNMITVQELSKKYSNERIIINSLYPGCVADTKLFRNTPWIFRFLFPIFQKFITKGYVSQRLAGERVAQVATFKKYAKPAVHWSWGNRQKSGRKAFSQKLSKRIIDSDISKQTYELTRKLVGLN
ncbi:Light dependent protochlorophyllide oxido-reductase [Prochlorococcus marinus str. MIT 9515]|uniref:protochlorophyllide reductase n=1 Tax=Prochlorococcus marinus (strain MIT 9515) TaxID=167542 RepID=A2BVK4_PROM5|nr:SDR family NAD(P)-dependent oxidoreductase [Prochlorococcus marinus]ABM71815.1 Light dependent protochlorophyllide oxido-reductase [Prochlorococcus marinus str. MIT 9515]